MSYSGFSASSTAEEVTSCIDGSSLVAIVTGGSHGIGAETCRVLALRGVHVVMAVRNPSAGGHVKEEIERQVPTAKIEIMELDLSSMKSVRRFANNFEALNLPLNILVNNAGIACVPFLLSEDGIELQFATNYLGHFLLTDLLLKKMKATAEESGLEGRIVIVASASHKFSYREGIRFNKINDKSGHTTVNGISLVFGGSYHRYSAYCQSKLANILHSNVLSNQLKEQNAQVVVNSLDPGVSVTNILNHLPFVQGIIFGLGKFLLKNVQQGAATVCYLALHPQVAGITGKYFVDCNPVEVKSHAANKELAKTLWNFSVRLLH